jgi:hypothetical protein
MRSRPSISCRWTLTGGRVVGAFILATDMKNVVRIALLAALLFLNGCGTQSALPPITGNWVFTLTPANSSSGVIQATAALTQLRNTVLGQVTLTGNGAACGTTAIISGTINNNALSLQITQLQSTITLKGSATTSLTLNATGAYTASTGRCLQNGGTGTWSAFLQGSISSTLEEKPR